jgi:hypothetical protein
VAVGLTQPPPQQFKGLCDQSSGLPFYTAGLVIAAGLALMIHDKDKQ